MTHFKTRGTFVMPSDGRAWQEGDTHWSNVIFHLDMDNSGISETRGHSVSSSGNVSFSSSTTRFGHGTINFGGGYLTTPSTTDTNLGNGDFSIDMEVYTTNDSAWQAIFDTRTSNFNAGLGIVRWPGGAVSVGDGSQNSGYYVKSSDNAIPLNTWVHLEISRSGSTLKIFANGIEVGSGPFTYSVANNRWLIGAAFDGYSFYGFMHNVRVTKGVARHTTNFTPPAIKNPTFQYEAPMLMQDWQAQNADPFANNVVALLHMNNSATDVKGHTVSTNGAFDTANAKFGSASLVLNGTQAMVLSANTDTVFPSDFTIDGWVKFANISTTWTSYTPSNQYIFDIGVNGLRFIWVSTLGWVLSDGTTIFVYNSTPTVNTWYHWAIQRRNNTVYLYLNGVQVASGTFAGTVGSASTPITFGNYGAGGSYGINGYLDEIRITKGVARYSSNFSVPTRETSFSTYPKITITQARAAYALKQA